MLKKKRKKNQKTNSMPYNNNFYFIRSDEIHLLDIFSFYNNIP